MRMRAQRTKQNAIRPLWCPLIHCAPDMRPHRQVGEGAHFVWVVVSHISIRAIPAFCVKQCLKQASLVCRRGSVAQQHLHGFSILWRSIEESLLNLCLVRNQGCNVGFNFSSGLEHAIVFHRMQRRNAYRHNKRVIVLRLNLDCPAEVTVSCCFGRCQFHQLGFHFWGVNVPRLNGFNRVVKLILSDVCHRGQHVSMLREVWRVHQLTQGITC